MARCGCRPGNSCRSTRPGRSSGRRAETVCRARRRSEAWPPWNRAHWRQTPAAALGGRQCGADPRRGASRRRQPRCGAAIFLRGRAGRRTRGRRRGLRRARSGWRGRQRYSAHAAHPAAQHSVRCPCAAPRASLTRVIRRPGSEAARHCPRRSWLRARLGRYGPRSRSRARHLPTAARCVE